MIDELTKTQVSQYETNDPIRKKKIVLFPINLKAKMKLEKPSKPMLRFINEIHLRDDYLRNYSRHDQINLQESDKRFLDVLKTPYLEDSNPKEDLNISNVVEMKYRMTISYE